MQSNLCRRNFESLRFISWRRIKALLITSTLRIALDRPGRNAPSMTPQY
jgi:hypothetical protein